MSVKMRQEVERKIATAVINGALKAGYTVSVNDGEETVLERSTKVDEILAKMFTTDEELLIINHASGHTAGWVSLIYGNDGYDVVHDYTVNLEPIMLEADKLADHYGN